MKVSRLLGFFKPFPKNFNFFYYIPKLFLDKLIFKYLKLVNNPKPSPKYFIFNSDFPKLLFHKFRILGYQL